jgi:regulation of enolase protein 1 (concanavalin A-like superfamily)
MTSKLTAEDSMQWHSEPPNWQANEGRITVTVAGGTDFWRKTHYGFIRDNGHFGYIPIEDDFVVEVQVTGAYRELYDQAGLMLRSDAEHWIKTGIEYVHGVQYVSAVVTNDFSDWSVAPLAGSPPTIWLRVVRKAEAVEIFYALDGATYTLLRLAYLPPSPRIDVGVMCAAPDGSGFEVAFEGFQVRPA